MGGCAAHFACGLFEFWRGGTRSRIVFLQVFARRPLILSDENTFFVRPQTDFIRLVSTKLVLWGVPVVRDSRFERFFENDIPRKIKIVSTTSPRILTWAVINGPRAKTSRKNMRERVPPLQNSKNPHANWAAKPPTFGTPFSSFGGVELARSLICLRFLQVAN